MSSVLLLKDPYFIYWSPPETFEGTIKWSTIPWWFIICFVLGSGWPCCMQVNFGLFPSEWFKMLFSKFIHFVFSYILYLKCVFFVIVRKIPAFFEKNIFHGFYTKRFVVIFHPEYWYFNILVSWIQHIPVIIYQNFVSFFEEKLFYFITICICFEKSPF